MDPEKLAIVREKVEAMCLFDDMFFASCLKDNKEGAAEILRPVLHDPNLTVESMAIQDVIPGQPGERGVRLDLKVLTGDGKLRIVEVHRRITEDLPKEARYRAAREDVAQLPEGAEPSELRDVYVIYLCETDPYDDGLPMYHVKSTIEENEKPYEEGRYIIYVNGQYRGDDPVGRLMHDMRATNPEDIYSEALRERAVLSKSAVRGGKKLTMQQEAVRRDWLEAFDDIWDRHHDGEMTALRKGIMDRDKQIQDLEKQIQDLKKQVADRNKQTPDQGEQIQDLKKQVMDLTKLVAELLQSGSAQHGGSSEPDQE